MIMGMWREWEGVEQVPFEEITAVSSWEKGICLPHAAADGVGLLENPFSLDSRDQRILERIVRISEYS